MVFLSNYAAFVKNLSLFMDPSPGALSGTFWILIFFAAFISYHCAFQL